MHQFSSCLNPPSYWSPSYSSLQHTTGVSKRCARTDTRVLKRYLRRRRRRTDASTTRDLIGHSQTLQGQAAVCRNRTCKKGRDFGIICQTDFGTQVRDKKMTNAPRCTAAIARFTSRKHPFVPNQTKDSCVVFHVFARTRKEKKKRANPTCTQTLRTRICSVLVRSELHRATRRGKYPLCAPL